MDRRRFRTGRLALALLAATVFVGLSLAGYDPADPPARNVFPVRAQAVNFAGPYGALVAHHLRQSLGLASWFLFFALATADLRLFSRTIGNDHWLRWIGAGFALAGACVALQILAHGADPRSLAGSGGVVGGCG